MRLSIGQIKAAVKWISSEVKENLKNPPEDFSAFEADLEALLKGQVYDEEFAQYKLELDFDLDLDDPWFEFYEDIDKLLADHKFYDFKDKKLYLAVEFKINPNFEVTGIKNDETIFLYARMQPNKARDKQKQKNHHHKNRVSIKHEIDDQLEEFYAKDEPELKSELKPRRRRRPPKRQRAPSMLTSFNDSVSYASSISWLSCCVADSDTDSDVEYKRRERSDSVDSYNLFGGISDSESEQEHCAGCNPELDSDHKSESSEASDDSNSMDDYDVYEYEDEESSESEGPTQTEIIVDSEYDGDNQDFYDMAKSRNRKWCR